ncbi:PRC-barrel domain-containing protein [Candidatus Woesearchaeota archaeon]|nr:PRC-barrel domain-containing protein [Candidatus Woesearchaeota archaeon]
MASSITSDDILGKTAVDPHGDLLGVVVKLHVDKHKKTLQGITVDQGFMKPDLFVGIEHVRSFGVDAVLLNKMPYHLLKGKQVLSGEGKLLGAVTTVLIEDGELRALMVSKKTGAFRKQEIEVSPDEIKEAGQNIILRRKNVLEK